jgi:hypothetical protein
MDDYEFYENTQETPTCTSSLTHCYTQDVSGTWYGTLLTVQDTSTESMKTKRENDHYVTQGIIFVTCNDHRDYVKLSKLKGGNHHHVTSTISKTTKGEMVVHFNKYNVFISP